LQSLVSALSEEWWGKGGGSVGILVSKAISPNDSILSAIGSKLADGGLFLVEPSGNLHGRGPGGRRFIEGYDDLLQLAREDPLVLMRQKLIRRIGIFRRSGSARRSTKYFYDGTRCIQNIVDALERSIDFDATSEIMTHAPESDWLRDVSASLALQHRLRSLDLVAMLEDTGPASAPDIAISERPLVLFPLVDSGETLREVDLLLRRLRPDVLPLYVAVLSTNLSKVVDTGESPGGGYLKKRRLNIGGAEYGFSSLASVPQVYYSDTYLPASLHEHTGTDRRLSGEPALLTSFAFWSMVEEAGWQEERDVPKSRSSLGLVPNFVEVMANNGPLIAYKLDQLLRDRRAGLPADPILVLPREEGAVAVAECLASMFACSVVSIPRASIQEAVGMDALRSQSAFGEFEWWKRLTSARGTGAGAILLDEFTSTGGTLARLHEICDAAGLRVEARAVLVDFGGHPAKPARPEVISLYQIPVGRG
jgi:hypothetical protein